MKLAAAPESTNAEAVKEKNHDWFVQITVKK